MNGKEDNMDNEQYLTLARDTLIKLSRNTNNKKFKKIGQHDFFRAKNFERENSNQIKSYYKYKRGTIVFVDFGIGIGSEFSLPHFAIVLNNKDNPKNGLLTVVPLSSKSKKGYVDLGKDLINNLMETVCDDLKIIIETIESVKEIHRIYKLDANQAKIISKEHKELLIAFTKKHDPTVTQLNDSLFCSWMNKEEKWINDIFHKYLKYDKNTFANVNNIKTISKLRIAKPLNPNDPIGRTQISEENLQKIEQEILKNITTLNIDKLN